MKKSEKGTLIALSLLMGTYLFANPSFAQGQNTDAGTPALDATDSGQPKDKLAERVHRQQMRIKRCLMQGSVSQEQADTLNRAVQEIAANIAATRAKNGGMLKTEEYKQMENSLNQSSNQIESYEKAGTGKVQSGDVIGPTWAPGLDGAQNPKKLKQEMVKENKRELRQERQANEQKIEGQQLQYEKDMVENLGEQRENLLKKMEQLKEVRQESGAN